MRKKSPPTDSFSVQAPVTTREMSETKFCAKVPVSEDVTAGAEATRDHMRSEHLAGALRSNMCVALYIVQTGTLLRVKE